MENLNLKIDEKSTKLLKHEEAMKLTEEEFNIKLISFIGGTFHFILAIFIIYYLAYYDDFKNLRKILVSYDNIIILMFYLFFILDYLLAFSFLRKNNKFLKKKELFNEIKLTEEEIIQKELKIKENFSKLRKF